MQRFFHYSFRFVFVVLLVLSVSCAKAPRIIEEQPKSVQQPVQVAPKPIDIQPVEQPAQDAPQPLLPVKRGDLVVISEPIGAEVYIDDKPMGNATLTLKDFPAGSYRVRVWLNEDYEEWRGNVDVEHQQLAEVRAELKPKDVALEVKCEPDGAAAKIDGKDAGTAPFSKWVSAGEEHSITIFAEGYYPETWKVTIPPGGREVVSVALEELKSGEDESVIINDADGAEMVLIPAGQFLMGSPEGEGDDWEHPQHTVFVDTFYMDKYEVTNAQYKQFVDATGHKVPRYWGDEKYNQPDHPVVGISWYDAKAYCQWAGKRLSTEAEWEKAARGGLVGKKYPWGDDITHDYANYEGTGGKDIWSETSPVGSFAPNGYGLCDMAGNVWEWCADWFSPNYYASSPMQEPTGPSSGSAPVLRGGGWNSGHPGLLRVAFRAGDGSPTGTFEGGGFRCGMSRSD